jgi:hypothetical protein
MDKGVIRAAVRGATLSRTHRRGQESSGREVVAAWLQEDPVHQDDGVLHMGAVIVGGPTVLGVPEESTGIGVESIQVILACAGEAITTSRLCRPVKHDDSVGGVMGLPR